MINVDLLKSICEVPGAPGHERLIRELVSKEISHVVDSTTIDNMGNLIAFKKAKNNPSGKKILLAAHMDEIGFIISHIDDKGFLRFHPIGGFDPKTLTAQRVIVHGKKDLIGVMGSKPIHIMSPEERNQVVKITDFFIDLGLPKEEVIKYIEVGNPVTRQRELIEMGNCVNCKSIDNRVSVFILIETLKLLQDFPYDVYAAFTVQEEVGIRGAIVAAHSINPDFGIAIDTTIAYDVPGAKPEESCTRLGEGAAIKIMDSSTICDTRMVRYLKKLANDNSIKWQPELLPAGGTDTAAVQRNGKSGSIAGAISIPTRHIHQVIEMADKNDISNCIQLLKAGIENLDKFDLSYS
ncbi:MAG: M42 family metallopeptidase [Cytophagales bacterium]|nr:M42 family metallopeptidase [Cytophagales bacterium]